MVSSYTVARYLEERLQQLGLDRIFGVAGNYTAPFLNCILENEKSNITISGNANEICAGFAADGYARFRGVGAVYVTYGVGSMAALSAIAGAYVEQIPIILINGAPTSKQESMEKYEGIISSHSTSNILADIQIYRHVTVAAERVTNAVQAPFQIDSILTALVSSRKPVYIEVLENVWRAQCNPPQHQIVPGADAILTVEEAQSAAAKTMGLLESRPRVIVWAGVEIHRFGLQEKLLTLLRALSNATDEIAECVGYVTSLSSKSVLSEDSEFYRGTCGFSNEKINELVGEDGVVIGLGVTLTGIITGNESIAADGRVFATNNYVRVGSNFFPLVNLGTYIEKLTEELSHFSSTDTTQETKISIPVKPLRQQDQTVETNVSITFDRFFECLSSWLTGDDIVVVDTGFSLAGAFELHIPSANGFIAQASWLSIGYSIAAATGIKCAEPQKRVIVVIGDGAFQQNCQAISDHIAYGHNTVVFVLANGVYGLEQCAVNPNPYRQSSEVYDVDLLNNIYEYNVLPAWKFGQTADTFGGGIGRKVAKTSALKECLYQIRDNEVSNFVVEVDVHELDCPSVFRAAANHRAGDDETESVKWPPPTIF